MTSTLNPQTKTTLQVLIAVATLTAIGTATVVTTTLSLRNAIDKLTASVDDYGSNRWTFTDQLAWVTLANAMRPASSFLLPTPIQTVKGKPQ